MRHNRHSTETTESHFLGTISAFSIRNHHDAMKERKAEENEVVEKAERMGSVAMELSAHLADLACPTPISPTQHWSLFSLSFFFFLPSLHTNLTWVFSFLRRSHLSFSFVAVGWFSWLGLLLWVLFLWLWVGFKIEIFGFDFFFLYFLG